jgi:cell division protein FtsB
MLEFRKKKRIRKIIYSPITLIFLCIAFAIIVKGLWGVYQKEKISAMNLDREEREYQRLSSREKNLADSINYLKTDEGVENEIRTKFRAVKNDERVAVIIDDDSSTTPPTPTTTPRHSFWYDLFY